MTILELKSTVTEIKKKSPERTHSRPDLAEERCNELTDRPIVIIQPDDQREKRMKKIQQSPREMWSAIIHPITPREGVTEAQEREKETENLSNI